MSKKYIIADWLVHGGHQYEFFKTGHKFFCASPDKTRPNPLSIGRPRNENVSYVDQKKIQEQMVNIIMVRAGVHQNRYKRLMEKYAMHKPAGIAVIQTTTVFSIPRWVRCVVWNSEYSMKKNYRTIPWAKHFYIPHGFDPDEFCLLGIEKNNKMLAAGSLYEQRGDLLGYSDWRWVADRLEGRCSLLGHGNSDKESIGSHPLKKLVSVYNEHSVFLNTTIHSAMPRTRGEAMMCGLPIVSTSNYGIGKYLKNKKNCIIANTKEGMLKGINLILDSQAMQEDLSAASRETALKYFHIDDYLAGWAEVFDEAVK
jgi:glycosyltransferase involved in cell wall biosynthesis